jgi:post-segregation antitoxin (ccd killing protein)
MIDMHSMARTTISLPDDLKAEMDALGDSINWSATAAEAFRVAIECAKVRRQRTEGKKMKAAIARLRESRKAYLDEADDRGHADGTEWAIETAEYGELTSLAHWWAQTDSCETNDALGPGGTFLCMISNDDSVRGADIDNFWTELGKDRDDDDQNSAPYWDGFVRGALEVFEQVGDD